MMTVRITGAQGCGKTRLALQIEKLLEAEGQSVMMVDEDADFVRVREWPCTVRIETAQTR